MRDKTSVHHWRFEDGKTTPNTGSKWEMDPPRRGWYCWVYPDNYEDFEKWMDSNCPNSEYTSRFNSGDPMYTVYIKQEKEAILFQLKWM